MTNENQMNPRGVLFALEEILDGPSLVCSLVVGKCWSTLNCCKGSAGQRTPRLPVMCPFHLQLKNEDAEGDLQRQTRMALVLGPQHDTTTTAKVLSVF